MDAGILKQFSAGEIDRALLQFADAACAVSQSLLEGPPTFGGCCGA
jgi:hypothetical protein